MKLRVTRPNATSMEYDACYWDISTRGELTFHNEDDTLVRAIAPGHWAEVEQIDPDPFTAATRAASA